MKIEQVHKTHTTWHTRVTVGEGKDLKTFGFQRLEGGKVRTVQPFGGTAVQDFESELQAMEFFQSLEPRAKDCPTDEVDIAQPELPVESIQPSTLGPDSCLTNGHGQHIEPIDSKMSQDQGPVGDHG